MRRESLATRIQSFVRDRRVEGGREEGGRGKVEEGVGECSLKTRRVGWEGRAKSKKRSGEVEVKKDGPPRSVVEASLASVCRGWGVRRDAEEEERAHGRYLLVKRRQGGERGRLRHLLTLLFLIHIRLLEILSMFCKGGSVSRQKKGSIWRKRKKKN